MSTSIFSNVSWGSGPNIKVSASYEYRRSGADMQYQITVSIAPITGSAYFGYSIQWYTNINGAGYASQGTLKDASQSQWRNAITATTDWITVSNKTSGSTSFALKVTSEGSTGSGRPAGEYKGYTLYVSPAESTMTVTSGTYIGSSWAFNINRNDSSFKHKIKWSCGGEDGYLLGTSSTTSTTLSFTWTPQAQFFGPILKDTTSKGIKFYLYTYDSSGNYIGSKSYSYTMYVPSYTPSVSHFTMSVSNDGVEDQQVRTTINNWGVALQGYSQYHYSFTPSYNYGAEVKSFSISNIAGVSSSGSGTWTSGANPNISYTTPNKVSSSGTFTPKLQYTDSRGKKCTADLPSKIYVHEYFKPQLKNVVASRCNSSGVVSSVGDHIKIACNPVFATVTVNGTNKNSVTTTYTVKRVSDNRVLVNGNTLNNNSVIIPTASQSFTIDQGESYQVTITTKDALNNTFSASYKVKTATATLHLKEGGRGVGIGSYCNKNDTLQVGWNTELGGKLDVSGSITFDGGEQHSERDIFFQNTTGTYKHKCELFGGDPASKNGIGLWDTKNSRRILTYNDVDNEIRIGDSGFKFFLNGSNLSLECPVRVITNMSQLSNLPDNFHTYGRAIIFGTSDTDMYIILMDSYGLLWTGFKLSSASTITWHEK